MLMTTTLTSLNAAGRVAAEPSAARARERPQPQTDRTRTQDVQQSHVSRSRRMVCIRKLSRIRAAKGG